MSLQLIQCSSVEMRELADGEAALVLGGPPYWSADIEAELTAAEFRAEDLERIEDRLLVFASTLRPVFAECKRVLARSGACILQTRDVRVGERLVGVESVHRMLMESVGFRLYARQLWWPKVPHPQRLQESARAALVGLPRPPDAECFLVFRRVDAVPRVVRAVQSPGILQDILARTGRGRLASGHRHQGPLPMLEAFIEAWTVPGELVVDPFAGGGSTLSVAHSLGRRAMGYEVDPAAWQLAEINLGNLV